MHFVANGETIPKATEKTLPVVTREENVKAVSFDWKKYQENLLTKVLGHIVFYTDVITSTQTVFDGLVSLIINLFTYRWAYNQGGL